MGLWAGSEGYRKPETYRANLYDQYKFCDRKAYY